MKRLQHWIDHLLFDKKFYAARYRDSEEHEAWKHYKSFGKQEGRFKNRREEQKLFDGEAYKNFYSDVVSLDADPWEDYNSQGAAEGRLFFYKTKKQHVVDIMEQDYNDPVTESIAVHAHLFHTDLVDDIVWYLNNIPYPFDIFASVSKEDDVEYCREKLLDIRQVKKVVVEVVPNQGRDIAPMFCAFGERLRQYDFLCHIHTKKSLGRESSAREFFWRDYLLKSLLGSEQRVKNIFHYLVKANTGMVFPEPYPSLAYANCVPSWFLKFPKHSNWLKKFRIWRMPSNAWFSCGAMFWCRTASLKRLFKSKITLRAFPAERGVLKDGSFAHALERLLGYVPLIDNFENFIMRSEVSFDFSQKLIIEQNLEFRKSIFDEKFYVEQYPDVEKSSLGAKEHFYKKGLGEWRLPCSSIPKHILAGALEKRGVSCDDAQFDQLFYLQTYYDAAEAFLFNGVAPYEHYQKLGRQLGFQPNDKALEDVRRSGLVHSKKVSIIVPVYKSEAYLENCLRSAYEQTMRNVEVVIVNDGSPDNSYKIIEAFRQRYPDRTVVITHEQNKGLVTTHRDGIAAASGEFFAILDGDDWLDLRFCEAMVEIALAYDAPCVCCRWTRPSSYTEPSGDEKPIIDLRVLEGDEKDNAIVNWNSTPNIHYGLNRKIYKTDVWREINPIQCDEDILFFEDSIVTINFIRGCKRVIIIKNMLYHWFFNPESVGCGSLTNMFVDNVFRVVSSQLELRRGTSVDIKLYERNVENIFIKEFLTRLSKDSKKDALQAKRVMEFFAELFDRNIEIFTDYQRNILIKRVMQIYFMACSDTPVDDFILFVVPEESTPLQDYLGEYWREESHIPFKYVQCTSETSLSEKLDNIRLGCQCRCVVTSGDLKNIDFYTNRPVVQCCYNTENLETTIPHAGDKGALVIGYSDDDESRRNMTEQICDFYHSL